MGGIGTQKGHATTEDHRGTLSPQEMRQRFDLLAAESREYAIFPLKPVSLEKLTGLLNTVEPVPGTA